MNYGEAELQCSANYSEANYHELRAKRRITMNYGEANYGEAELQ